MLSSMNFPNSMSVSGKHYRIFAYNSKNRIASANFTAKRLDVKTVATIDKSLRAREFLFCCQKRRSSPQFWVTLKSMISPWPPTPPPLKNCHCSFCHISWWRRVFGAQVWICFTQIQCWDRICFRFGRVESRASYMTLSVFRISNS